MQLIEQQISSFESELHRVAEAQEFQGQLLGTDADDAQA